MKFSRVIRVIFLITQLWRNDDVIDKMTHTMWLVCPPQATETRGLKGKNRDLYEQLWTSAYKKSKNIHFRSVHFILLTSHALLRTVHFHLLLIANEFWDRALSFLFDHLRTFEDRPVSYFVDCPLSSLRLSSLWLSGPSTLGALDRPLSPWPSIYTSKRRHFIVLALSGCWNESFLSQFSFEFFPFRDFWTIHL